MNWVLYLLGHNPEIQKKVHRELDEVFGKSPFHPSLGFCCICEWNCVKSLEVEGDLRACLVGDLEL